MSVPAVYLVEAEDDVVETHAAYEKSQPGFGDRFLVSLQHRVQQIQFTAQLYGVFRRDVRAAPLRSFPYIVYYRDRGTGVLIIAVQHGRRSTKGWRGRV